MKGRTEVEVTNRNRAAVRSVQRRFSTGVPRTLLLTNVQLKVVRANPWLWITGEDWDGPDADDSLEDRVVDEELADGIVPIADLGVAALKERLKEHDLPTTGRKEVLVARLEAAEADEDADDDADDADDPVDDAEDSADDSTDAEE